jgi:large subunit ribosomal protein L6
MIINLPEGVKLEHDGLTIKVSGPKGELKTKLPKGFSIKSENSRVSVLVDKKDPKTAALHGTSRALIANMVKGVNEGWSKTLELVGTGYRAELKGSTLVIAIGYSHPIEVEAPEGISFKVEKTLITIESADKQLVGLTAAKIRQIRQPEPYKGKGIRYQNEQVRRKPGKAAKAQGAAA